VDKRPEMSGVPMTPGILRRNFFMALIAMCGRLPVGKDFFDDDAELVGAAMCPAC